MSQKTADANGLFIFWLREVFSDPLQHNINHIYKLKDVSSLVCEATVIYGYLLTLTFSSMSLSASVLSKKYKEADNIPKSLFLCFHFKCWTYGLDFHIHLHISSFSWVFNLPSFNMP